MKSLQPIFTVLFLFSICSSALSQRYLSKYVITDAPINLKSFEFIDDEYHLFTFNYVGDTVASSIIELDENFDILRMTNHLNVSMGRFAPRKYGNTFFAYGADQTNRERHLLIQMDESYHEIKRDSFYPRHNSFNANGMTMIDDLVVGSSWDFISCPQANDGTCEYMNYKVINTDGVEINSIDIGRSYDYFFSFEVDRTDDGEIICGGNRHVIASLATVYNFDTDGNINWRYESPYQQSRGNVPVFVEELSNGSIVYTDKIDMTFNDEYIDGGYTGFPARLVCLSSDGIPQWSFLDSLNWLSASELTGVYRGRGDYFFAYGTQHKGNLIPEDDDGSYAFLMKISKDGEILWRRLYKHDSDPRSNPAIHRIYEHENGDITTVGREVVAADASFFTWMMRVNEFGCLDDENCDAPLILPTKDIIRDGIRTFPNPSHGTITIEFDAPQTGVLEVVASNGILIDKMQIDNKKSSSLFLEKAGVYLLRFINDSGELFIKKTIILD